MWRHTILHFFLVVLFSPDIVRIGRVLCCGQCFEFWFYFNIFSLCALCHLNSDPPVPSCEYTHKVQWPYWIGSELSLFASSTADQKWGIHNERWVREFAFYKLRKSNRRWRGLNSTSIVRDRVRSHYAISTLTSAPEISILPTQSYVTRCLLRCYGATRLF